MIKQTTAILMLAIAALGFSGIAAAQNNASAPTQQQQQIRQLVQKLRSKTMQLKQIHAATIKANPDLKAQQKAFGQMVRNAIEAQGYDIEAGRSHLENLVQKLQSGNLSKQERKQVLQKIQAERRALNKARVAALQQPKIQKAGKALQQATLAAMKAYSDQTKALLQDIKHIRQKLRALMQPAAQK